MMHSTSYLDFDLLFERRERTYHARVLNSPAGQASVSFRLPFDEVELDDFFGEGYDLSSSLLLAGASDMSDFSPQSFGARLFGAVFREGVAECLRRSLDVAAREGVGLRLRLRLTDVPDLAALPWEYLYDPSAQRFFVLSDQTPVVRYLELQATEQPLLVTRPLRILTVIASPSDYELLNVEQEWQTMQQALQELEGRGLVVMERLGQATLSALQQQLRQGEYHILHFIGHGFFDEDAGRGGLIFEGADGSGEFALASVLGALLGDHRSLRLVFLNACEGGRAGQHSPFAGTAQYLVQQGLPSVIAMQFAVSDEAAIALSHEFYRALADGYPVGAALAEARKAIFSQSSSANIAREWAGGAEWAIPALFMRAPDGCLFEIEGVGEEGPAPGTSPFKGLQRFEESDANIFYGRETLTEHLVVRLEELLSDYTNDEPKTARFLAVIGASGSGKSSLVRAGLIPALKSPTSLASDSKVGGQILPPAGSELWPVHIITPTSRPLEALAATLTRHIDSITSAQALAEALAESSQALHLYVRKLLAQDGTAKHLLLVIDQFEELFTLCHRAQERQAFVDNLMDAVMRAGPTIVLITLRADFYAQCAEFDQLRTILAKQQEFIGPMTQEELRRAIEGPALEHGWELETGLVEQLLHDVGHEPGALPLLSHALLETWKRRRARTLTLAGYTASGGVRGAIANTAEIVFNQKLTELQKNIARMIFLRLTEIGTESTSQDTRRRVMISELIPRPEEAPVVEVVLRILVDVRLVITFDNSAEVAHEALIREWPTLRNWLDENREGLLIHRRLSQAAQEWQKMGQDASILYRGARLAQALEWAESQLDELNPLESRFLQASKALADQEIAEEEAQQRYRLETAQKLAQAEAQRAEEAEARERVQSKANSRLWRMLAALAALVLVAVGLAFLASRANNEAQKQTMMAQKQSMIANTRQFVAQAQEAELLAFPQRGLLLALASLQESENGNGNSQAIPDAEEALRHILSKTEGIALSAHQDEVISLALSPDHNFLVTGSQDGSALLWDLQAANKVKQVFKHDGPIWALAISPNGQWLLTGSDDTTARLWDLQAANEAKHVFEHNEAIRAVAISPDGQWLVTASDDGIAYLHTRKDPSKLYPLEQHQKEIRSLAFSPNGQWLVTASFDGTAYLYPFLGSGEEPQKPFGSPILLSGDDAQIKVVAINDQWLVMGDADGNVSLWNFTKPEATIPSDAPSSDFLQWDKPTLSFQHPTSIAALAFSPDGKWLATADEGGVIILHSMPLLEDGSSSTQPKVLTGHTKGINAVVFDPKSRWLVSISHDRTARVWDLTVPNAAPRFLRGHEAEIWAVAVNDQSIVTSSADGTARLWDLEKSFEGSSPIVLQQNESINDLTMSLNGQWLVTASDEKTLLYPMEMVSDLYNAPPQRLTDQAEVIEAMAISPNNRWLVTAAGDKAYVWNLQALSDTPRLLASHSDRIGAVAFSPDNNWFVTGSADGTVGLYPTNDWESLADASTKAITLDAHQQAITSIAISPNGRWLVTGSDDATARLWDLSKPDFSAESRLLKEHKEAIKAVAISPDGHWLVTGGADNKARLWDLSQPDLSSSSMVLEGHSDWVISVAFDPDSHLLATGGSWDDKTIRLWDLRQPIPIEPMILRSHEGAIETLAFSPDKEWLVTGAQDGIRLWDLRLKELQALACRTAGRNLSYEEWQEYFNEANYSPTCPDLPVHKSVIDGLRTDGITLAQEGNIAAATGKFEQLGNLIPDSTIEPKAEAEKYMKIQQLLTEGTTLAQAGDIQGAINLFRQAIALEPSALELEAEAEAKQLAASALVKEAKELAKEKKIEPALANISQAQLIDPEITIDANAWHLLCQLGDEPNPTYTEQVLAACNNAIELEPEHANHYLSRGIVHYEMGNQVGAREDFNTYLQMTGEDKELEVTEEDGELEMTEEDGELEMTEEDGELEITEEDEELEMTEEDGELEMTEEDGELEITEEDEELEMTEEDEELEDE